MNTWLRFQFWSLCLVTLAVFASSAQAQLTNIQWSYTITNNNQIAITGLIVSGEGPLEIPATLNDLPVTAIGPTLS